MNLPKVPFLKIETIQFALCLISALVCILQPGCQGNSVDSSSSNDAPPVSGADAVTLALNWFPDAQHGGFYAAETAGFYQAARLKVDIIPGGPAAPVLQNIALRRADFAVANADQVLMARAQGMPIIAVFAAMQDSPRCILVHRETGITSLQDLHDVTLALGAGKAFAEYLQKKVPLTNVNVVPYTGSIAPFLADPRFAQQAYVFSEPFFAQQQGTDPVALMVSDLGFNPYTSCLVVHEDLLKEAPDRVQRFVNAVQQGWLEYLQNPEATNKTIHAANPQADLASLTYGVKALQPLCRPAGSSETALGTMSHERWQTLNDQLTQLGLINSPVETDKAFTNQFVPRKENR